MNSTFTYGNKPQVQGNKHNLMDLVPHNKFRTKDDNGRIEIDDAIVT